VPPPTWGRGGRRAAGCAASGAGGTRSEAGSPRGGGGATQRLSLETPRTTLSLTGSSAADDVGAIRPEPPQRVPPGRFTPRPHHAAPRPRHPPARRARAAAPGSEEALRAARHADALGPGAPRVGAAPDARRSAAEATAAAARAPAAPRAVRISGHVAALGAMPLEPFPTGPEARWLDLGEVARGAISRFAPMPPPPEEGSRLGATEAEGAGEGKAAAFGEERRGAGVGPLRREEPGARAGGRERRVQIEVMSRSSSRGRDVSS